MKQPTNENDFINDQIERIKRSRLKKGDNLILDYIEDVNEDVNEDLKKDNKTT